MNDNDLNLPQRKVIVPEVLNSTKKETKKFQFTEKQVDVLVSSGARAVEDMGQIIKDLIAIARIREESAKKVSEIEAEIRKTVLTIRADIDRLAQVGQNIRTRGQIAADILTQTFNALKEVPDHDDGSRHRMIDSISTIMDLVLREE